MGVGAGRGGTRLAKTLHGGRFVEGGSTAGERVPQHAHASGHSTVDEKISWPQVLKAAPGEAPGTTVNFARGPFLPCALWCALLSGSTNT